MVEPEVTRDEIIGGRRVIAMPANPPHANQQSDLDYVLRAHVAPGYVTAADLLTRLDEDSDFASDACTYKEGIDPATGTRYLEEIAFEVVSEQTERDVTEKAVRMQRRGVRRIFSIAVKGQRRVSEWSPERQGWRPLAADSLIEDPSLVAPLEVAALLDAAVADNAVVEALAAKGNPAIRMRETTARSEGKAEGKAEGRAEGKAEGKAEGILNLLKARGVAVSEAQRQEIFRCYDLDRLDQWLVRAMLASSVDEITSET
ncbi:MAG TPA: Uma2 family endonuclease [Thermoanaerobaculia bacterium]|nr:Uma2 family endonuclease [Thermoanaerobaculia bacterium]